MLDRTYQKIATITRDVIPDRLWRELGTDRLWVGEHGEDGAQQIDKLREDSQPGQKPYALQVSISDRANNEELLKLLMFTDIVPVELCQCY